MHVVLARGIQHACACMHLKHARGIRMHLHLWCLSVKSKHVMLWSFDAEL